VPDLELYAGNGAPVARYHEPLPRPHRPGRIGQGDAGPGVHL